MSKSRGNKNDLLTSIKGSLQEGLNNPNLLKEYVSAVIKSIEEEIEKFKKH